MSALLLAAALLGGGAAELPRAAADLGRVDPPFTEPFRASVVVRNTGASAVVIDRAVPHCAGCTRIAAVPGSIPPGGTGEVRLHVEPGRSRGRLRFGATLLSGGTPWCTAEVTMLVPGIDTGGPGAIDLGTVAPGAAIERAIPVRIVASPGAACAAVARGSAARAWFEGDGTPGVPLGHGLEERRGRVVVAFAVPPDARDGVVEASVDVESLEDGRSLDRSRIEIRAWVGRPSSAAPAALFVTRAADGGVPEFEVLLPSRGAAAVAEGATILGVTDDGAGTRLRLRPDLAAAVPVRGVRRGVIRLRCGVAAHDVPWLGFDLDARDGPPTPAILREVIAFKRDLIRASTSAYVEETFVAAELLRAPLPGAPPGSGVRIRRWVHRSHDGCFRTTAIRPDGAQGADITVTDGRTEARSGLDGATAVREQAGAAGHALRAEWEAVAGMLGSVARGTARDGLEDLAEAIDREPDGGVEVAWDRTSEDGRALLRVTLGSGSPLRVWLDPGLGLAVVRREQSVDDGTVVDRVAWTADGFFRTACGIELPGLVRTIQQRGRSAVAELCGTPRRIVHDQTLRCLAFRIDPPSGEVDRSPERLAEQVRHQALASWDEGRPRQERP